MKRHPLTEELVRSFTTPEDIDRIITDYLKDKATEIARHAVDDPELKRNVHTRFHEILDLEPKSKTLLEKFKDKISGKPIPVTCSNLDEWAGIRRILEETVEDLVKIAEEHNKESE